MPSFADSIFLFVLALLLFGPKKLPVLARELGKWVGEFRRASNEFKMQMEDELRLSEQADRQKQIAAMEAAAPLPPPLEEPEHPHLAKASAVPDPETAAETARVVSLEQADPLRPAAPEAELRQDDGPAETLDGVRPLPIATSGDLQMMPPPTGLPTPRQRPADPLGSLLNSLPEAAVTPPSTFGDPLPEPVPETTAHGD